jgi:hypothetical protein
VSESDRLEPAAMLGQHGRGGRRFWRHRDGCRAASVAKPRGPFLALLEVAPPADKPPKCAGSGNLHAQLSPSLASGPVLLAPRTYGYHNHVPDNKGKESSEEQAWMRLPDIVGTVALEEPG